MKKTDKSIKQAWKIIAIVGAALIYMTSGLLAGSLQISWDAVPSGNVAGYLVKYGTTRGNYSTKVDVGKINSFQIQNLVEGQSYYLAVAAYDGNKVEGLCSSESVGTVLLVANPAASGVGSTSATISWNTNKAADGQVEYWTGTSSHLTTPVNTNLLTGHSETLSNLIPNTSYSYRVLSKDSGGSVSTSSTFNFQTTSNIVINAGGAAVGTFGDDTAFSGGTAVHSTNAIDLSSAIRPAPLSVYQSARTGTSFSYTFKNLSLDGTFILRLHFVEPDFTTMGQRMFRVYINGSRVLNNFDIVAKAGKAKKAYISQLSVTPDRQGKILVNFLQGRAGNPLVNGLELIPNMTPAGAINAGGSVVGSYDADTSFTGGTAGSSISSVNTSGVVAPAPASVYRSWRSDNVGFDYSATNIMAGSYYLIRMHFAENTWRLAGQRLFDVILNGREVLSDFDILANAGTYNQATVQEFIAVADVTGKVQLHFGKGSMDVPQVNGLEAYPVSGFVAGVNAGGSAIGDFKSDAGFSGGTVTSTPLPIDATGLLEPAPDAAYQSQREGIFSYTMSNLVPAANHIVRLHFAESTYAAAGQRVFSVSINNKIMLRNFDVLKYAGGPYKAVVREFLAIADNNGQIKINFTNGSAGQAMVSAIEILN
jgi:hypothetical protein